MSLTSPLDHSSPPAFATGVIEGFYGQPWTFSQRLRLFQWMSDSALRTYLYAPKEDLKHRLQWRIPYSAEELSGLARLVQAAQASRIDFVYAIAPGLDIQFGLQQEERALQDRFRQLQEIGVRHFALLFDDIPIDSGRSQHYKAAAAHQAALANHCLSWLAHQPLLFCPTVYCDRMAAKPGAEDYLKILGKELHPDIEVFWTGPEIVSCRWPEGALAPIQSWLNRKPLIWDNLHANDYDMRRLYLGPYSERPPVIFSAAAGIFLNPNCQFESNYIPIRTFGNFCAGQGTSEPRRALDEAVQTWLPQWRTVNGDEFPAHCLRRLVDAFYLPHRHGSTAASLLEQVRSLPRSRAGLANLRQSAHDFASLYDALITVADRHLVHTFYRHVWELKEEMNLLITWLSQLHLAAPQQPFHSDEHRPPTYRGGFLSDLQQLFPMDDSGAIRLRLHLRPDAAATNPPAPQRSTAHGVSE